MSKDKKSSLGKTIANLIVIGLSTANLVGKIVNRIGLEARLARRSLIQIIILAVLSAILLASTWICVLAMFYFYLASLNASPYFSLLLIIIINILSLIIIAFVINQSKKNLLFPEVQKELKNLTHLHKDC